MPTNCPICKRTLPEQTPEAFPFCSARCKLVDLGAWLGNRYAVAAAPLADDEAGEELAEAEALALLRKLS